ncbi:MAG: hypothetical protein HGA38_02695 [Candidatus Moranbacteria bacterium]|nr:hypothetical protein [Candidatus Moranbacteria bacterium]
MKLITEVAEKARLASLLYGSTSPFRGDTIGREVVDLETLRTLEPLLLESSDVIRKALSLDVWCDVPGLRESLVRKMAPVMVASFGYAGRSVEELLYEMSCLVRLLDSVGMEPEDFRTEYSAMVSTLLQACIGSRYVGFTSFIAGKIGSFADTKGDMFQDAFRAVMEEFPDPSPETIQNYIPAKVTK